MEKKQRVCINNVIELFSSTKFAFLEDTIQLKIKMPNLMIFCHFHEQAILTGCTGLVCRICVVRHRVSTRTLRFPCLPSK